MNDVVAWSSGEAGGPRVIIRDRGERVSVVLEDGRGRYLSVSPSVAAQLASGIDVALERIDRNGRIARTG
jgi:hypothetical protein